MNEKMNKPTISIRGFMVRFLPALLLVSALFYMFGSIYARVLLPVFAFEIELFHPEYEILSYGMEENQNEGNKIYYTIKITRPIFNKRGVPLYDKQVRLDTVASVLYIQPIIVFSLLLAWPALTFTERGWGLLTSVPLMLAAASIDIPVFFIYTIESGFPVGSLSEQIRIMLNNFFSNGGRQFLALLVVLVTVGLISIMKNPRVSSEMGPNDLCPCGSGKKYKKCCMNG
ncbi:MAG: SEC-C domain-containing protein [Syntrophobacterales bacterium]|nr:MAG: SEC-C domain-containing protein [Syntrophobacterales bacterium]